MTMVRASILSILLAPILGGVGHAVDTPLTLAELTKKSDYIVIGTVKRIEHSLCRWQGLGVMPFRQVTIEIDEQWKGELTKKELTLQVPGGKYPNGYRLEVEHQPKFRNGEKVLVFTRRFDRFGGAVSETNETGDAAPPAQWVFGGEQGKYTVVVKRVVGKKGMPIEKDILTHPLRKRVTASKSGTGGK